jgi:DNA-binding GntR family transcriptional regulator
MAAPKLVFERPKSLTETAADTLRQAIINGELALGEQISESALASSLGLSKTPVREALLRLQAEGLVHVSPHRGTFVFSLEPGELTQICELRLALESAAFQLSMERNQAALVAAWERTTALMGAYIASGDVNAYLIEDSAFHQAIINTADNRYFTDAYERIAAKVTTLRLKLGRDEFHMRKSYDEHLLLLDHARHHRHIEALDVLRRHIARKEGSYWEHLDPTPPRYLLPDHDRSLA